MIKLRIHDESDLYSPYDPDRVRISESVYHYLKTFCTEIESKKHLHDTLRVISDSAIDEKRFKQALQNAVRKDQAEFDRQIALNHRRALWGYAVGISLSAAGFALSVLLDQVLLEVISFVGTIAVKDAVMIHAKINPDIRRLKKLLDPFCDFKLEVIVSDGKG